MLSDACSISSVFNMAWEWVDILSWYYDLMLFYKLIYSHPEIKSILHITSHISPHLALVFGPSFTLKAIWLKYKVRGESLSPSLSLALSLKHVSISTSEIKKLVICCPWFFFFFTDCILWTYILYFLLCVQACFLVVGFGDYFLWGFYINQFIWIHYLRICYWANHASREYWDFSSCF